MNNLTDEQRRVFYETLHNQFIQPELDRRSEAGTLPVNFKIRECLILLPNTDLSKSVVQFNEEIEWEIEHPNIADRKKFDDLVPGETFYLHQILRIEDVLPPAIEDKRVAFYYLYWDGFAHRLLVDLTPIKPGYDPSDEQYKFDGRLIAHHLQNIVIERVVSWAMQYAGQLRQIGLWIATPLLPYPLSKIVERIDADDLEGARTILVHHCDLGFITDSLVETWSPIAVFRVRKAVFQEALSCHENGYFMASIVILIGHIEGVITDWLYEILQEKPVEKTILKERMAQFQNELRKIPDLHFSYREAIEALIDLLEVDKENTNVAIPFQVFIKWNETVNPAFPSRHAISHGKYIPEMYNEENSIKLFLLLDTICQCMMFYEVRVLNRTLEPL